MKAEQIVTQEDIRNLLKKHVIDMRLDQTKQSEVDEAYRKFISYLEEMDAHMTGTVLTALGELEYTGLRSGDYLDDPVAGITDGKGFGMVDDFSRGVSVEINVGLDCTGSMSDCDGLYYYNNQMVVNPIGAKHPLFIAPRMFFGSLITRYIYKSIVKAQSHTGSSLKIRAFTWGEGNGFTTSLYTGEVWLRHPNQGGTTNPDYFFKRVREEEFVDSWVKPNRLDLLITDGQFNAGCGETLDRIQDERKESSASLTTVVLRLTTPNHVPYIDEDSLIKHARTFAVSSPDVLAKVMNGFIVDHIINAGQH